MPKTNTHGAGAKAAAKLAGAKLPEDRSAARAEALNEPQTFTWDGEEWTVTPADATGLEFMEALEDEELIRALRLLLGRDQTSRLVKGRKVEDLETFFDTMGEAVGTGNL